MAKTKNKGKVLPKSANELFQTAFNMQKYYDSENEGIDTCGTYNFCSKCIINLEFPCAKAFNAYSGHKD